MFFNHRAFYRKGRNETIPPTLPQMKQLLDKAPGKSRWKQEDLEDPAQLEQMPGRWPAVQHSQNSGVSIMCHETRHSNNSTQNLPGSTLNSSNGPSKNFSRLTTGLHRDVVVLSALILIFSHRNSFLYSKYFCLQNDHFQKKIPLPWVTSFSL